MVTRTPRQPGPGFLVVAMSQAKVFLRCLRQWIRGVLILLGKTAFYNIPKIFSWSNRPLKDALDKSRFLEGRKDDLAACNFLQGRLLALPHKLIWSSFPGGKGTDFSGGKQSLGPLCNLLPKKKRRNRVFWQKEHPPPAKTTTSIIRWDYFYVVAGASLHKFDGMTPKIITPSLLCDGRPLPYTHKIASQVCTITR